MMDLDVPRNNTRVPLLHWLATNVSRANPLSVNTTGTPLVIPAQNPVPYLQPSPPVGDIPHAYTFILLRQPRNFSIPPQYAALAQNRVGFNLSAFLTDAGLLDAKAEPEALASNWIRVQNTTGTPTTSAFPPPRPSPTGGSGSGSGSGSGGGAHGNAAVALRMSGKGVWVGIGTTVFAAVFAAAAL